MQQETVRISEEVWEEAVSALKHVLNWQCFPRDINFEAVKEAHDKLLKAGREG